MIASQQLMMARIITIRCFFGLEEIIIRLQIKQSQQFELMISKACLFLLLLVLAASQSGSIQITPTLSTLYSSTTYLVSYYTVFNLPSTATFALDFTNTYITVPNASLNVTATVKNVPVNGATAVCASSKCTLKLNNAVIGGSDGSVILFTIGNFINPYFIMSQMISTKVTFNGSYSQPSNWTIVSTFYTPMAIKLNQLKQSDEGVGNTDVKYTFNFTIPMVPNNPQLSIQIPSEVEVSNIQTNLSFYGSIQNLVTMFGNIILFSITYPQTNATGYVLLSISGITNPKSLGSSSSFVIQLLSTQLPGTTTTCSNCVVAQINKDVFAKSTVPGKIITSSMFSSNSLIGQQSDFTINSQLFASIPERGMYKIILPSSVKPVLPVNCYNVFAFTIINASYGAVPSCSYDAVLNTISTNNFVFNGIGSVILRVTLINPPDARKVDFLFQTFDAIPQMIGNSSTPFSMAATPLPLTVSASKSNYQVDTSYRLTVNLTLAVALQTNDRIQVILPQANYITNNIVCSSAGININCSTKVDNATNNIVITVVPPCTSCSVGAQLSFIIDGLTNPSFINTDTQSVIVQTTHPQGAVQNSQMKLQLTPSILTVSNYTRSGLNTVGSTYSLSFSCTIPTYVTANGGQLVINFNQYDTYANIIYNASAPSQNYNYPTQFDVTDSSGNSYSNSAVYYTIGTPTSIQQIIIQICGSGASCGNSFIIKGLRKSFNPLVNLTQTIQIATVYGQSIANTIFSIMAYNTVKNSKNLGITLSNSVTTLNSNYLFDFVSVGVPFQSGIIFAFLGKQIINGGCFLTHNSSIFTGIFNCQLNNSSSILITYNGDSTFMMIDTIAYTITITSVTNPSSVAPIVYSFTTTFNSIANQKFSSTYSIQTALPLTFISSKTNYTYAQPAQLTITLTSAFPSFDQIKLSVPVGLLSVVSNNSLYQTIQSNNFYQVSQIYSLVNGSVSINIINPFSTSITGSITFSMFSAGYLSATGSLSLNTVQPVYLGLTATVNSHVVGEISQLTVNFNRVNSYQQESLFFLSLTSSLFDYSIAQYNGAPLVLPLSVPIGVTSVLITKLKNIPFVPSTAPINSLIGWTVDSSGAKVALSSYIPTSLIPTTPTSAIFFSFVRTNTAINGIGSLTIKYTPKLPTSIGTMTIMMPANQTNIVTPSCTMTGASNGAIPCVILSNSPSYITIQYFNQSITTLTNVQNIEPNSNSLNVYMLTSNNELVESTTGAITPNIQYNSLSVTGTTTSSIVASNTQLKFTLITPNPIDVGSKIVINLPDKTYTKLNVLITQDCSFNVLGNNYTGCRYGMNGNWVIQVNLTNFGTVIIPAGSNIPISIFLTNAWTSTLFGSNTIVFYVDSPADNFVSQGTISLTNLYAGASSLTPITVDNIAITQTSTIAASSNSITLKFILPIPVVIDTTLLVSIPKSGYTVTNSSNPTNWVISSSSENSSHINDIVVLPCGQVSSALCNTANYQYTFVINVVNNPYVQMTQNSFSIQLLSGSDIISFKTNCNIPLYAPQILVTPTITRTNNHANQNTNVIVSLSNIPNSSFNMIISPITTSSGSYPILNSITYAGLSTNSFTYNVNSTNYMSVSVSGLSGSSASITISGANNLLVGLNTQKYTVTIKDSNYVYFSSDVTLSNGLIPFSSGLTLQRIVTTVGLSTNIYLNGALPMDIPAMSVSFKNNSYSVIGKSFNISLGSMVNSDNVDDSTSIPIIIKNSDYIAYSSSLPITPTLTSQILSSFVQFKLPSTMSISQNITVSMTFNNVSFSYLSVKMPSFFKKINYCCIDSNCSQSLIISCNFRVVDSNNMVELTLKNTQTTNNIYFSLSVIDYQMSSTNSTVSIYTALPSSIYSLNIDLNVLAVPITSTLTLNNWKVNAPNTYTLTVQPINRIGFIRINLPSFISSQLTSTGTSSSYTLTLNGTTVLSTLQASPAGSSYISLAVTDTASFISLLISSVNNPINNEPFEFLIQQAEDQQFSKIYGVSKQDATMKIFDSITVTSATRSVTKVGVATQVTMSISTPSYSDKMIITFPLSQIQTTAKCQVTTSNQSVLPCTVISSNSIQITNAIGTQKYTISGLMNQKAYESSTQFDLVTITMGSPYIRASTVDISSTYITPRLTLGSIILRSFSSSNPTLLSTTTLTYAITIENSLNINGFLLKFDASSYLIPNNLNCMINNVTVKCSSPQNSQIFLPVTSPVANDLTLVIGNIFNYIKTSAQTLTSVKTQLKNGITTYSDVDLYYNDGTNLATLKINQLPIRVILPFNYVQSTPVTFSIIIDSQFPSYVPTQLFKLNFTAQNINCQSSTVTYLQTLTFTCSFSQSTSANIQLSLYHQQYPSTVLSLGSSNMFIYPEPTNKCNNQLCDSCSTANGIQYCFSCREGLYSSNGQCKSQCDVKTFPYENTNICQSCSPTCYNCFGAYSNQCLSCQNASKVLDSGSCENNCPADSYSYNNFCITNPECQGVDGCRLCSNKGFCYECLPDYLGAPVCKYTSAMPPTFMIYFLAPIAVLGLLSILFAIGKCTGTDSVLSQTIFSVSFIELFAWIFAVPVMTSIFSAMVLLSFLTLRIIISIVSYQVFYKKNMGELSQKLLEEQSQKQIEKGHEQSDKNSSDVDNWKTKFVRFMAHFNGPDSYQLLKSKIALPVLSVNHNFPIQVIFMLNRLSVTILMFYMISKGTIGDSVMMPAAIIASGGLVSFARLMTWDKIKNCMNRCRT